MQSIMSDINDNWSDYPFVYTHRVRFNEIDGQGIVFNGHYLTFFDHALTEYLRAAGIPFSANDSGIGEHKDFNVVKSVIEYSRPAFFDDLLDIYVRVGRIGRSSLQWELLTIRRSDQQPVCRGEIIWVYSDQIARQSEAIPENLKQQLLAVKQ